MYGPITVHFTICCSADASKWLDNESATIHFMISKVVMMVINDADSSDSLIQTEETMEQTSETVKECGIFSHRD